MTGPGSSRASRWSALRTVVIVVRREYLERVRTRTFVFTTLAAPFIMVGLAGLTGYLVADAAITDRELLLIDRTEVLADRLVPRVERLGFRVQRVDPESEGAARLQERVESGEVIGAFLLDEATLAEGRAVWLGREEPPALRTIGIRQALAQTVLEVRLGELDAGDGLRPILDGGRIDFERVGGGDAERERARGMGAAFAGSFFLYFVLLVYGTVVLRAVQEEKSARIAEIIASAIRPWQLMLGKVLGVGAVGLTQLGIWLAFGLGSLALAGSVAGPLLGDLGLPEEGLSGFLPDRSVFLFFTVCFLAGYFIYASLFAAVGAMCSSEEEAQQLQVPVVLLVLIPFLFLIPVLNDPGSGFAVGMSLFPFFSPVLMFARVAVSDVPLWQSGLSVVLMIGALLGTAWVAGRIYRTGLLMQGKRPTLPELWRWVREG